MADTGRISKHLRQLFLEKQQRVQRGSVHPPRANDAANAWLLAAVDRAQAAKRGDGSS